MQVVEVDRAALNDGRLREVGGHAVRRGAVRAAAVPQGSERRRQRRCRDLAAALADDRGLLELDADLFQSACECCFLSYV